MADDVREFARGKIFLSAAATRARTEDQLCEPAWLFVWPLPGIVCTRLHHTIIEYPGTRRVDSAERLSIVEGFVIFVNDKVSVYVFFGDIRLGGPVAWIILVVMPL